MNFGSARGCEGLRTLSILSAASIVLAVAAKNLVPPTVLIAWGLPLGTHYVHLSWFTFWALLIVGLIFGALAILKTETKRPDHSWATGRKS